MSHSIAARYALRSLRRHSRRTMLSIFGIGLGCAICLFVIGWVRGERRMMMNAAAASGSGHFSIVPEGWIPIRTNDFRIDGWEGILARLRAEPRVRVATPRARVDALLAFGTQVAAIEMVGVDPRAEPLGNRLVRRVVAGRYLKAGDEEVTVIGEAVADRLRVEVGDPLMVTVSDHEGEMRSAMLRIEGIVATGSRELDATICHVALAQVARLTGRAGAGEIAVTLVDAREVEGFGGEVAAALPEEISLLTWDELRPELSAGVEVDEIWARLVVIIIMTVVFLGIASAQLAAVLERRREFGVLSALGMPGHRLLRVMSAEALLLGSAGGLVALLLGVPATWYVATFGVDFGKLLKMDSIAMSNILIDPIFHSDFGWWLVPLAFFLAVAATLLSSLYPAWYAIRTDPATALRVDH